MRREVRCVLVGDSGVGKSTIITSLVKEGWAPRVQRVVPELTLPPTVSPEGVTIKIIDTAAVVTANEAPIAPSRVGADGAGLSTASAQPGGGYTSTLSTQQPRPSSASLTAADQQRAHLEAEIRRASVICLVYSIATPSSFERIPTFWLPYIRSILGGNNHGTTTNNINGGRVANGSIGGPGSRSQLDGNARNSNGLPAGWDDADAFLPNVPVILVGNKIDLRSSDPALVAHPSELTQAALEQELAPVMAEFREVETCVEASAFLHVNISEIFYYAQKAVLYPTAPLYDSREQKLRSACIDALKRIFLLCDNDQDGVLNDRELNNFQRRCFDAPLHPQELEGVKELVLAAPVHTYANYASYDSGYGSSGASASGAGQGQGPRRSAGPAGSAAGSNRHAPGPEGRSSMSGSSTTASSTTAMGNGRRLRANGHRADSFTSNETISNNRRRRTLSSSSSTSGRGGHHPHIRNGGLTLAGFLYLHTIFIQRGRLETTWTVLRAFGYACPSLLLEDSYVHPPFPVPPDHAVELSPHGYQFLTDLFEAYDQDRDGALSEYELDRLFALAPGGEHPWTRRHGADFPVETTTTDQNGNITLQGWLAQWSMTTLLEPRTTLAFLAFLGYPSYGVSVTGPSTPPASSSGKSSSSSGGFRSYFSSTSKSSKAGSSSSSGSGSAEGSGSGSWGSSFGSSSSSSASSRRSNAKPRPSGPPTTTTALKVVKIPRKAERERFLRRGFGLSTSLTPTSFSLSSISTSTAVGRNEKAGGGNKKQKGVPQRSVLLGYVFGAAGSGKTALLRAMVGREFDPLPSAGRHGGAGKEKEREGMSTHSVVSAVEYGGAEKYLILQEFEAAQEAEVLKSPKRLAAADVAVFVYDATDPASFKYLVEVRKAHPQLGGLPSLFVATKADLLPHHQAHHPLSRGGFASSPESVLGSSPPHELYRVRSPTTPSPHPGRATAGNGRALSSAELALANASLGTLKAQKRDDEDDEEDDNDDDNDDEDDDETTLDPHTYCAEHLGLSIPALHNTGGPLEVSVRAGQLGDVYSVLCAIALDPTGAIPDAAAWDREVRRRAREGSWFSWLWPGSSSSSPSSHPHAPGGKLSKKKQRRKRGKKGGSTYFDDDGDEDLDGGVESRGKLVSWQTSSRSRWIFLVLALVIGGGGAAISLRLGGPGSASWSRATGEAGLGLWRSMFGGGSSGGGTSSSSS